MAELLLSVKMPHGVSSESVHSIQITLRLKLYLSSILRSVKRHKQKNILTQDSGLTEFAIPLGALCVLRIVSGTLK